jgi:hypothetical protein
MAKANKLDDPRVISGHLNEVSERVPDVLEVKVKSLTRAG